MKQIKLILMALAISIFYQGNVLAADSDVKGVSGVERGPNGFEIQIGTSKAKVQKDIGGAGRDVKGVAGAERGPDGFEIQIGTSKAKAQAGVEGAAGKGEKKISGGTDPKPFFMEDFIGRVKPKGAAGYVDRSTCDQACRSQRELGGAKPSIKKRGAMPKKINQPKHRLQMKKK